MEIKPEFFSGHIWHRSSSPQPLPAPQQQSVRDCWVDKAFEHLPLITRVKQYFRLTAKIDIEK
jgi:hypothetical protein